jgi:hypothetical protein
MTIEIALLGSCCVVLSALIWRLNWVLRLLGEVRGEVNAVRDMVSRVFLMQLNSKTGGNPPSLGAAPPTAPHAAPPPWPHDATAKNEHEKDARQLELELETAQIHELCAKLITLVPPQEAAPLLVPDSALSGARERRLVPRHQTSKVGEIILHHGRPGDVCTVRNMSPAGALLLVADAHGLPEQFDLDMDGYSRRCTARWRRLDRIGVKFKSMPAA